MSFEQDFQEYMKEEHNVETDGFNVKEDEEVVDEEQPSVEEESEEVIEEDDTEEETEDSDSDVEESTQEEVSKKFTFKADKEEYEATIEELLALAPKAIDYTNKTKKLAKHRPMIELAEEAGVTIEEFKAFIDAKNGNKEAFAMLANKAGVDPIDIDGVGNYQPTVEQVDYDLKDIVTEIRNDTQYGTTVNGYISKLPDSIQSSLADNPQVLKGIHIDTQKGISQKIMPEVIKRLTINPNQNFVELYQEVGTSIFSNDNQTNQPKRTRPPEGVKKAVIKKKRSSQPRSAKETLDAFSSNEDFVKLDEMIRSGSYK